MSEKTALITGASGYLASWVVKVFLESGWTVHGTVRNAKDPSKAQHLHDMVAAFPGKLKLFEADLLKPGSFREAMEGCSVVVHTASPFFTGKPKDVDRDLIKPALEGTRNVLETANEVSTVQRVVLTSSVVAVHNDAADLNGRTATEEDWNNTASPTFEPYSYSKTIAERKAWEIAKSQNRWDLVVINPGFILGPSLSSRIDSESNKFMVNMGDGTFRTGTVDLWFGLVDVRDAAKAHLLAAERKEASGRHITINECASFVRIAEILQSKFGKAYPFPSMSTPKWLAWLIGPLFGLNRKYISRHFGRPIALDNSWVKKDLGMAFIPLEQTVAEHFQKVLDDGLVPRK
jgi:nucleoside-diphosphate-sugar epimerase